MFLIIKKTIHRKILSTTSIPTFSEPKKHFNTLSNFKNRSNIDNHDKYGY